MTDNPHPPTEGELREPLEKLLRLLTTYYFHAEDEELAAVNRLRRLLGWREQLPKEREAELQWEEAEGPPLPWRDDWPRTTQAPGRYEGWGGYGGSDPSDDERKRRG